MYEDKLIVSYNEKTQYLYVRSNQSQTFDQKIEFGRWYEIQNLEEETLFSVQLINEGGNSNYTFNVQGVDEDEQPEDYDIYDILNNQKITIFKGELKPIYLELEVQCGEYEFTCKSVHKIPVELSHDEFADEYARDFYGSFDRAEDDNYYFNCGELAVSVYSSKDITPRQYGTLRKFI